MTQKSIGRGHRFAGESRQGERSSFRRSERGSEARRRFRGRFDSLFTADQLFDFVSETGAYLDRPWQALTQAEFDQTAAAALAPIRPPSARAICMRLGMPWRSVCEIACDSRRSETQSRSAVQRSAPASYLMEPPYIYAALRRVAIVLRKRAFTRHEYAAAVREMLGRAPMRAERAFVRAVMPDGEQIVNAAGSWEIAMELLRGGAERDRPEPRREAVPIVDALEWAYEARGIAHPSERTLRRVVAVSIRKRGPGRPWRSYWDELVARRRARGVSTPEAGPPEESRLSAAQLEQLVGYASQPMPHLKWTRLNVLEALEEFISSQPSGTRFTQRLYHQLRRQHRWPALHTIQSFGPWGEMIAEAARRRAERSSS